MPQPPVEPTVKDKLASLVSRERAGQAASSGSRGAEHGLVPRERMPQHSLEAKFKNVAYTGHLALYPGEADEWVAQTTMKQRNMLMGHGKIHIPSLSLGTIECRDGTKEAVLKLPCTTLDTSEFEGEYVKAQRKGLSNVEHYLWKIAQFLEGCTSTTASFPDLDSSDSQATRISKYFSTITRHNTNYQRDDQFFVSLYDVIDGARWKLIGPEDFLVTVFMNPKARFELTYPEYRVSGQDKVVPYIYIRATQGHQALEGETEQTLAAAQTELTLQSELPIFCVHGTSWKAYKDISTTTKSLLLGGPTQKRAAVHFAVFLPADTGSVVVSGF